MYSILVYDNHNDLVYEESVSSYEEALEIADHMSDDFFVEIVAPDGEIETI